MAYDRIPGVDENYRFPPEVEGGVNAGMVERATSTLNLSVHADKLVRTNDFGRVSLANPTVVGDAVPKNYVDTRVPVNLPITEDNSVGKRIFIGDTMVYGDTGWRDIRGLLMNGWVASEATLRREGNEIEIRIRGLDPMEATSATFFSPPTGFKPGPGGVVMMAVSSSSITADALPVSSTGNDNHVWRLSNTTTPPTTYLMAKYNAHESWPPSLPGTPKNY